MAAIGAGADGSYRVEQGDRRVRVGIIDTGVDGSHPDIAPNFNRRLSRNFTTDDPLIDGPCEEEPDRSCEDPADVDENEHGTHVAGIIGAPLNGLGTAGVAPRTELVNLRAGQDSGYFFLQPTVDALTYAAKAGIDVVNMSFYVDPWLFNCASNPADSPEEQAEQRTIIEATQRALRYARDHGVTLVAAAGNQAIDLGRPETDEASPGYPPGSERPRTVDNSCLTLPAEGDGVIAVTSTGPSGRKAYYSSYGVEQADVSAPGGDTRDHPDAPAARAEAGILAPFPEALARADDRVNPDGTPNDPFVVRDCAKGRCAYYQYLQGTSMASPHAAGVAALIVARYGHRRGRDFGLDPRVTERILQRTAVDTACPEPRTFVYPGLPASYTATCEGPAERNGFFGEGVVHALRAVTAGH
jgi:subtilisin family serine protease